MFALTVFLTCIYLVVPTIFLILSRNYYYIILLFLLSPLAFYLIALLLFLLFLFILLLSKDKNFKFNYKVVRSLLIFFSKALYFFKVKNTNWINFKNKRVLLVGNHKAKLDPIFLIIASKEPISFTPKSDLYKSRILRFVFKKLNAIKINRDDIRETVESLKIAKLNMIEKNINYVVFPEGGTKNRDSEKMSNTKSAAYKLALMAESDILPFSIKNSLGFKKYYKKTIYITYHNIIRYNDIKDLTTNEIDEIVLEVVNSCL